jgi:Ser/Thr protein kinase RdoA (MazF antagonist)
VGRQPHTLVNSMTNDLMTIAASFADQSKVEAIKPFGNGNINDTFLVTTDALEQEQFILQRINTRVFRQPQLVMQNMCVYTQHVHSRLQNSPLDRRWEVPQVLLTPTAQSWVNDNGSCWRAISYIHDSQSFDVLTPQQAPEVGYALGMFHNLISDLPPDRLADTLEGFHITPLYLQQYEKLESPATPSAEEKYCLKFVDDRQSWATVLETAKAQNKLPLRLMHGDPKVNNVMFDRTTQKAVSVIDLDTVKPGLVHYDIGDCLRSGCNPMGEETLDWQTVQFDPDLCQGILQGYFSVAKAFFTDNDYSYLYDAIRLLAFELGLRFFTDYLAGNVYFKVKYPEHNLIRSLVQFKLTESIEFQEATLRTIIRDLQ